MDTKLIDRIYTNKTNKKHPSNPIKCVYQVCACELCVGFGRLTNKDQKHNHNQNQCAAYSTVLVYMIIYSGFFLSMIERRVSGTILTINRSEVLQTPTYSLCVRAPLVKDKISLKLISMGVVCYLACLHTYVRR